MRSMRYALHAVIGAPEALEPIVEAYPHARPSLLDGGELALLPLCAQLYAQIDLEGFPVGPETGFERLSSGVAALVTACSRRGPIAYLEAAYEGDRGRQTAAVWLECRLVYGPRLLVPGEPFPGDGTSPIGQALRYLGVHPVGGRDEFVVLGLGRHRDTEHWCAAGIRV